MGDLSHLGPAQGSYFVSGRLNDLDVIKCSGQVKLSALDATGAWRELHHQFLNSTSASQVSL